jgi:hypothetical protein
MVSMHDAVPGVIASADEGSTVGVLSHMPLHVQRSPAPRHVSTLAFRAESITTSLWT